MFTAKNFKLNKISSLRIPNSANITRIHGDTLEKELQTKKNRRAKSTEDLT